MLVLVYTVRWLSASSLFLVSTDVRLAPFICPKSSTESIPRRISDQYSQRATHFPKLEQVVSTYVHDPISLLILFLSEVKGRGRRSALSGLSFRSFQVPHWFVLSALCIGATEYLRLDLIEHSTDEGRLGQILSLGSGIIRALAYKI